jgi:hypothetical protein
MDGVVLALFCVALEILIAAGMLSKSLDRVADAIKKDRA